jgi:hypothetical protein
MISIIIVPLPPLKSDANAYVICATKDEKRKILIPTSGADFGRCASPEGNVIMPKDIVIGIRSINPESEEGREYARSFTKEFLFKG